MRLDGSRVGLVIGAMLLVGCACAACGGASREAAAPPSASAGSEAMNEAAAGGAGEADSQPAAPQMGTGTTMQTSSGIADWEARLDQAAAQLASAGSDCREICRASGDICTAAREICTLTGDGDATPPADGRCGRARGACEQASRQRGSACPVCPSAH